MIQITTKSQKVDHVQLKFEVPILIQITANFLNLNEF